MKKPSLKIFFALASIALLMSACAKVDVPAIKKMNKIALVTLMAPEDVNTSEVSSGSLLALAATAAQSDSTSLKPMMDAVKDQILRESKGIFRVQMVPESQVLSSKFYKAIKDENMGGKIAPDGYKQIYPNQTELVLEAIKGLRGVDGALIVMMDAKLEKAGTSIGVTQARVNTTLTMHLFDATGKKVLMQGATRSGDKTISSFAGVWRGSDLKEQVNSSVSNVLEYVKEMIDDKFKEAAEAEKAAKKG
ncbi:MAG: hypothetical protein RRB13_08355 [bacterium]|nr:hypothetical protein [bacterium]